MIEVLKGLNLEQIQAVLVAVLVFLGALVSLAEVVVRLTPTTKDDGFVKRMGSKIDMLMDLLKVPNRKKIDG